MNIEFMNGQTTCDPMTLVADRIIREHEKATGKKVKPWSYEPMIEELPRIKARFKAKYYKQGSRKEGNLTVTGFDFVPHYFDTLEAAKEEGNKLISIMGDSLMFLKTEKGYTFVPKVFDAATNIYRTARACGAEIVDEIIVLK